MRFLFVIVLLALTFTSTLGTKCMGAKSISNCDADYTPTACGMCAPGDNNCNQGYQVSPGTTTTGQVCGTSSMNMVNNPLSFFNVQMCCPTTYYNESYYCVSQSTNGTSINGGSYAGLYYTCGTQTGKDFVDDVISWLKDVIIVIVVGGVLSCLCCAFGIAWSCCGLRSYAVGRGYWRASGTALLVSQPSSVAIPAYQPPVYGQPQYGQPQYGQPQYSQQGYPQQQQQQYGGYNQQRYA